MSVAKLMTALMNEHNGPQETNRVQYNKEDVTWVIRPPRNYKLDSSLPPNMAIIDRREKAVSKSKLVCLVRSYKMLAATK